MYVVPANLRPQSTNSTRDVTHSFSCARTASGTSCRLKKQLNLPTLRDGAGYNNNLEPYLLSRSSREQAAQVGPFVFRA